MGMYSKPANAKKLQRESSASLCVYIRVCGHPLKSKKVKDHVVIVVRHRHRRRGKGCRRHRNDDGHCLRGSHCPSALKRGFRG